MKFLKALTDWGRRKDQEVAEKLDAADPVGSAKLAISDSKEKVNRFTVDITKMMAHAKSVKRNRDQALAEAKKFGVYAKRAADAQDEEGLREALEKKADATQRADSFKPEIRKSEALCVSLKKQLASARAEIATAQNELSGLKARHTGAGIRKDMASARAKFDDGENPLAKLRKLRETVEAGEDEAGAMEELAEEANPTDKLAEKYGDGAAASSDVDDEVAKMLAAAKS